jgi:hypothetical protein
MPGKKLEAKEFQNCAMVKTLQCHVKSRTPPQLNPSLGFDAKCARRVGEGWANFRL